MLHMLLLTAVVVSGSAILGTAQKRDIDTPLPKPERRKLVGMGEPDPDVRWEAQKYLTESFYPIGWSRDGKLAYLVEPPDEACGCYFAKFVIQDLKTDKIIWQDQYTGEIEVKPEEDLNSFWPQRRKMYSAKLREHGIEPHRDFKLLGPRISFEGDVITPRIDIDITTDGVFEVEGKVTVNMDSKRLGTKVIRQDVYKKEDVNGFRNAEIAGVLLSPFEPRAAVIIVEELRGYEGPPNITRVKIVGSTLKTGFKK